MFILKAHLSYFILIQMFENTHLFHIWTKLLKSKHFWKPQERDGANPGQFASQNYYIRPIKHTFLIQTMLKT